MTDTITLHLTAEEAAALYDAVSRTTAAMMGVDPEVLDRALEKLGDESLPSETAMSWSQEERPESGDFDAGERKTTMTEEEAVCLVYHLGPAEHTESYKNPVLASAREKLRKLAYPREGKEV